MKSLQALGKTIFLEDPNSGDVIPAIVTKTWSADHCDTLEPGVHLSVTATAFDAHGGVVSIHLIPVYQTRREGAESSHARYAWVMHE